MYVLKRVVALNLIVFLPKFNSMKNKKTLVLGASTNDDRYSNQAVRKLKQYGHDVVPVGLKTGVIKGLEILTGTPDVGDIDTVTLYIGPQNQANYVNYILKLKPNRVIFNPGTENEVNKKLFVSNGIEVVEGCTLVMLSIGTY